MLAGHERVDFLLAPPAFRGPVPLALEQLHVGVGAVVPLRPVQPRHIHLLRRCRHLCGEYKLLKYNSVFICKYNLYSYTYINEVV